MDDDLIRLYLNDPDALAISADNLAKIIEREGDDFYGILAEGWRIKMGSVSDWYDASIDGRVLSRDQVFKHCLKMVEMYESMAGTTWTVVELEPNRDTEESEF